MGISSLVLLLFVGGVVVVVTATDEYMVYTQRALSSLELSTLQLLGVPIQQYYVSRSSAQSVLTVTYDDGGGGGGSSLSTLQSSLANAFGSSVGFTAVQNRQIQARADATPSSQPSIVRPDSSTPSWALDRIDQSTLPLDGLYKTAGDSSITGANVHAYIFDTGVNVAHADFGGRAVNAYSVINNGNFADQNGHGTHVAGLVGSTTWGVAKQVTLHNVRVLDASGSGTLSGLAQALLWVRDHAIKPAVVNLSLGFYGYDSTLASIIADLIAQGIVVHAAAGNDGSSACNHYPSAYPGVVSVGATDSSDSRSSFSNWGGSCSGGANPVSIMSPGSSVKSTWNNGGTQVLSGTSMATPLVTGASALLFQQLGSHNNGANVRQALLSNCTKGQLRNLNGSPNCLLMVGVASTATPSPSASRTPSSSSSGATSGATNSGGLVMSPGTHVPPPANATFWLSLVTCVLVYAAWVYQ